MDNFYKVDEVAEIFNVKPITIRKWCQLGFIKARKFGKSWYIFRDDLSDLIDSSGSGSLKSSNGFLKEEYIGR
jgi:excisionase family DNA binding protein